MERRSPRLSSTSWRTGSGSGGRSGSIRTVSAPVRSAKQATSAPNSPGCHSGWRAVQRQRSLASFWGVSLGVLGVGLEPEDVGQALLGVPHDVVVLVLRASDLAGLGFAGRHEGSPLGAGAATCASYPGFAASLTHRSTQHFDL